MKKTALVITVISVLFVSTVTGLHFFNMAKGTTIIVPDGYPTIQEAINNAASGDTILVRSGVYYERITINKTVALIGENKESTIIDGNASGTVVEVTKDFVSISEFTIQNSGDYPSNLIKLNSNGNNITNNVLRNSGDRGIEVNFVNNTVADNQITNTFYGILLMHSSGNNILRNNVSFSTNGIMLYEGCTDNFVYANNISNNNRGIYIGPVPAGGSSQISYYNTVSDNNVFNNDNGIMVGGASFNTILINNTIWNNDWGIYLQGTRYNFALGNNITKNELGIYMDGECNSTSFSHNNFINNNRQIENRAGAFRLPISWDGGYPFGGNYWSDYQVKDIYSGLNQNITGSDGIGDVPYIIDLNSKDNYPFMVPCEKIRDLNQIFTVFSNSTVTEQYFEAQNQSLSFTATGPDGTNGYFEVFFAESLLANSSTITVILDGKQMEYDIVSMGDSGVLTANYNHSAHKITVNFAYVSSPTTTPSPTSTPAPTLFPSSQPNPAPSTTPTFPTPSPEPQPNPAPFSTILFAIASASLATISIGLIVYFKKRKH